MLTTDISVSCPFTAEPPTPGAHVPLEFVRPEGARRTRCLAVLRHGVRVRLQPPKLARMLVEAHVQGQPVRLQVTECSVSSWGRTRVEMHLEVGTLWAAESPSCGPAGAGASTAEMARPVADPGRLALQRLAEREALWAAQTPDSQRQAIVAALREVQTLVREWLGGKPAGPGQPSLFGEARPGPESLLSAIQLRLSDASERARRLTRAGPRARGRERGLREGLDIVASVFGRAP